MSPRTFGWQPPGGEAIGVSALVRVFRGPEPRYWLTSGLSRRLGALGVELLASGRESLRVAFAELAKRSDRNEIVVPAYACYSIPAAVVAAGLRVRLVDVDGVGRIDPEALRALPLDRVAALVVTNLFGVPEPVASLLEILRPAGVALVDDAAQCLGGRSVDGVVGGRGSVGVLSFCRGKPLSGLGGGGLAWHESFPRHEGADAQEAAPGRALLRAAAWALALRPAVFRGLAAIPALRIGETRFDPEFRRGGIDGASLALAAACLDDLDAANRARAGRAERLAARLKAETEFVPLRADVGAQGVYPRLGILAPDAASRDAGLRRLQPLGASPMYPAALTDVPDLAPHRVGDATCPHARDFARRILTLPTHRGLEGVGLEAAVAGLRNLRQAGPEPHRSRSTP